MLGPDGPDLFLCCEFSAVSGGLGCLAIAALIGLLCPAFVRYQGHSAGSRG